MQNHLSQFILLKHEPYKYIDFSPFFTLSNCDGVQVFVAQHHKHRYRRGDPPPPLVALVLWYCPGVVFYTLATRAGARESFFCKIAQVRR